MTKTGYLAIGMFALLAIRTTRSEPHAVTNVDMVNVALRELVQVMQHKYPGVTEWSIEPLADRRLLATDAESAIVTVEVMTVGSRSAVQVAWSPRGAHRKSHTVWFDVVGKKAVVVAAHDLKLGDPLESADVRVEFKDVVGVKCSTLESVSEVNRMRAKRSLRVGGVLCQEFVELRPAVSRGEECVVRYTSERISLTTRGVAQQDAEVGARTRIVNPITKESFAAVVTADREVTVHE